MLGRTAPLRRLRFAALLALLLAPACFVSFNDYPLGDTSDGAGASPGGSAGASSSAGGSEGGVPSDSGGAAGAANDAPSMIDNFEDGNQQILDVAGRSGSWYAANDGRGNQTPRPGAAVLPSMLMPARGTSTRGLHTMGGPFETWGALIGTALASDNNVGIPYDLSGYRGIRLWVRLGTGQGSGPGSGSTELAQEVRLNLSTPATEAGGGCTMCGDHFGFVVPLTSQWERVEVVLAEAEQAGFGVPLLTSEPDLAHVTGLELFFPQDVRFDLWVDDIELF